MIAVIISLYILVLVSESVSTILLALHLVSKVSRKSGIDHLHSSLQCMVARTKE